MKAFYEFQVSFSVKSVSLVIFILVDLADLSEHEMENLLGAPGALNMCRLQSLLKIVMIDEEETITLSHVDSTWFDAGPHF